MFKRKIYREILLFLFLFLLISAHKRSEREIRVLLWEMKSPVMLESRGLQIHSKLKTLNLSGMVQIEDIDGNLMAQGKKLGTSARITGDGPISVNGKSYRGGIQIEKFEGRFLVINFLDLEDYLAGVVKNEMSSKWPMEALKAQTVLARTYALGKIKAPRNEHYDVFATVEDQVYSGMEGEDEIVWKAVNDTRGEVLFYRGALAEVYYHSCCGGFTEPVEYVWGGSGKPYLGSVKCDYCQECPYYFWRYPEKGALSAEELATRLGYEGEAVKEVRVMELSPGQRVLRLELTFSSGYKTGISGNDFRVRLGRDVIRSTLFKIEKAENGFIVFGSGSGHGVGLCQWGAKGMAESGKSYREILGYYFAGTDLKKAY